MARAAELLLLLSHFILRLIAAFRVSSAAHGNQPSVVARGVGQLDITD